MKLHWVFRVWAVVCAITLLLVQVTADLLAVPSQAPIVPFLDGRPPVVAIVPAPEWRPESNDGLLLVRFEAGETPRYGLVDGDQVVELVGGLFDEPEASGVVHQLRSLRLVSPIASTEIGAVWEWRATAPSNRSNRVATHHVTSPRELLRQIAGTDVSVHRRVVHIPGVRGFSGSCVGTTCGLAARHRGALYLALGPGIVAHASRALPSSFSALGQGDIIVEPRSPGSFPAVDLPQVADLSAWVHTHSVA